MKILHVIPNPFYFERGGLIRAHRQIKLARESGFECHVACYHFGKDLPDAFFHRIPKIPWYRNFAPGANIHRLYLDLLLMNTTLFLPKECRPDIIHAHLHEGVFAALPLAHFHNIPLLFDAEGSLSGEMEAYGFFCAAAFKIIERYLVGKPDCIMTSSRQLFHSMHRRYHVPKNKIVLFEDHIDTEAFAQREPDTALRDRLAMPKGAPVVAFIGSLDKLQGIDLLLDIAKIVAARAPQTYFLIMGYPDEKIWEDRFKHAGVFNCRFPGLVSRSEAPEYLSLGSVAVSAKRSGSSQANGKLLDYMAVGLPVVVFDDEINQDILGAYGAYATNGDIEGFAALVLDFINNPAACRKAGEGLRQRVCAQFSSKTHGKKLLDIYKAIISDDLSEVAADPRESP